jgi:hypothetical protein
MYTSSNLAKHFMGCLVIETLNNPHLKDEGFKMG